MSRGSYTRSDGRAVAQQMVREARETHPDDQPAQDSYVLGTVRGLLAENMSPRGKPFPASFWRGLGTGLSGQ